MKIDDIENSYKTNFEANSDLKVSYNIKIVDVNENPAAIAVSVNSNTDKLMSDELMSSEYQNIVIVEGAVYE